MPQNVIIGSHCHLALLKSRSSTYFSVAAYVILNSATKPRQSRPSQVPFSTSAYRFRGDNNKNRGVSALRRTGPRRRQVFSVERKDLPEPVFDKAKKSEVEVDPEHGLWQFFNTKRRIFATPEEDAAHGRSWAVEELRHKSWEDLHKLWWICIKERNRLETEALERRRLEAGYGDNEAQKRDKEVKKTMDAIKHTLTERWYAYEEAKMLYEEERLGKKNWRESNSRESIESTGYVPSKRKEMRI